MTQFINTQRGSKGEKGDTGQAGASVTSAAFNGNNIDFGLSNGSTVTLVDAKLELKGDTGDTGAAATVDVGSTTTGQPGTSASVTNSGTTSAAILDFTIPKGDKGDTGDAATISVGTVSTGAAGSSATVTNSGTSSAAVFDFTIPKGDKGDTGNTGAAATISVGSTTTGQPGTSASVTNSGTSSAAVFDFVIPEGEKGDKGDTGNTGATGNGIASVTSSKSGKITTVTITETNGNSDSFTVSDGEDGEGSGDVLGPSSVTDGSLVLFDGTSGKLIKQGGVIQDNLTTNVGTDALSAKQGKNLKDSIDTINGKIPSAATTSNQLADKDFVNSSINSVAAYYITKNSAGDQFATYAELSAATTFYSGGVVRVPTRNDYCIVASDENHDNATTRYSYNSGWEFQYIINETALTQAQLDALNSGITANKVSTYDGYATGKQNTLESGTNIKTINGTSILGSGDISTPNTTYSAATSSALGLIKLGSDTVQSVSAETVSGTNGRTYAMQVNSSGQGVVNVPWENTTYESKAAASGGTDLSLVTTGEKATWNGKQNALTTQTAYTSKGTATKVPTITTNTLGQVTSISETNITFPVTSVNGSTGAVTGLQPEHATLSLTLAANGWSSNTQTVTATGVTASNTVIISPAPASFTDYGTAQIYASAQASNSLTFTCGAVPTSAITVNVVILN